MRRTTLIIALGLWASATPASAQFSGPGNTPSAGDYYARGVEIGRMQQQREDSHSTPPYGERSYQAYPSVQPSYPAPMPAPPSYGYDRSPYAMPR